MYKKSDRGWSLFSPKAPDEPDRGILDSDTTMKNITEERIAHHPDSQDRSVDDALVYLRNAGSEHAIGFSNKELVRKIDWLIMPFATTIAFLQYLDKTLINYANVMGLSQDTHTSSEQFSYLALAFYVGYLTCELPSGYLMQRFPLAKYLGANIILWGICVALNCVSTNYVSLVVLRVLLGCFESAVTPGLILITSMWYTKKEQSIRVGIWFSATGTAVIVGSLASFGFQHYHGVIFKSWQIMFLVCGVVTIAFGLVVILYLPDNPMNSRLSAAEKAAAIERVRNNKTGIENKQFNFAQMIEALLDPHVWMISLLTILGSEVNGALGSYQASIIKGFGYTSMQSALLSIPSGALAVIVCSGALYIAGTTNQRTLTLLAMFPLGIIGAALMAFLPPSNKAGKLAGNYLTNMVPSTPIIYALAAANISGHSKKITVNAIIMISFSVGNIIGPLTFTGNSAPNYLPAKISMMCFFSLAMMTVFLLRKMLLCENAKRARMYPSQAHLVDSEFMNLTDRENKEFRYSI